jgi:glutamyl-tRNA synthetase
LLRKEAVRNREIPKYDGRCRHLEEEEIQRKLTEGLEFVVRLKVLYLPLL